MSSDIETLVIEYGNHADQFNIIDSFEILNKINFIKLKSLILYTNWYVTSDACWVESNYFNDLLHRMNVIDKFVTSNPFECINIKDTADETYEDGLCHLYCYMISFGEIQLNDHKKPNQIDDILNKKVCWDQVGNIISKWCKFNNKYNPHIQRNTENNSDKLELLFKLEFCMYVNLGSNVNTLCKAMKWINTMINSLCISENTIDFGGMMSQNTSPADGTSWSYLTYDTASKFEIHLNSCIEINGAIVEKNQFCRFEMNVIIDLL